MYEDVTLPHCHCWANQERILQAEDIRDGLVDVECDCEMDEN